MTMTRHQYDRLVAATGYYEWLLTAPDSEIEKTYDVAPGYAPPYHVENGRELRMDLLCEAFYDDAANCPQCPIGQRTRRKDCRGTPRYDAWMAKDAGQQDWRDHVVRHIEFLQDMAKEADEAGLLEPEDGFGYAVVERWVDRVDRFESVHGQTDIAHFSNFIEANLFRAERIDKNRRNLRSAWKELGVTVVNVLVEPRRNAVESDE